MDHSFSEILLMSLLYFSPRKSLCFDTSFISEMQLSMSILSVLVVTVFTTGTLSPSSLMRVEKLYLAVILASLLSAVLHSWVWADSCVPDKKMLNRNILCRILMSIAFYFTYVQRYPPAIFSIQRFSENRRGEIQRIKQPVVS